MELPRVIKGLDLFIEFFHTHPIGYFKVLDILQLLNGLIKALFTSFYLLLNTHDSAVKSLSQKFFAVLGRVFIVSNLKRLHWAH